MMNFVKPFFSALTFLTILPVPQKWVGGEKELRQSLYFYPVVGLLIGLFVALIDILLRNFFPVAVASVIDVMVMLAISRGLHMDGFADTTDGFFSSRPKEKILEIMRDSRSGPMAVAAVACLILLKCAAVYSLPSAYRWQVISLLPFAGRSAIVAQFSLLAYARSEGGLATCFGAKPSLWKLFFIFSWLVVVGGLLANIPGIAMGLLSFAAAMLFAAYSKGKIGGYTGDTLGASCEIAEIVPALTCIALQAC